MTRCPPMSGASIFWSRIAVAAGVLALWLSAAAVKAQPYRDPDYKTCVDPLPSAETVIAACTALRRHSPVIGTPDVAFGYRGQAHERQGDLQGALADYDEAVRLFPANATPAYLLALRGSVRLALGDVAGAKADLDSAVRLDPRLVEARESRALARRKAGDLQGALSDMDEAVRLADGSFSGFTLAQRARLFRAQGDITAALADLVEATRILPCHLAIGAEFCWTRLLAGPSGGASKVCKVTETLARSPDALVRVESAELTRLLEDQPDAAAALRRALTAETGAPWVYRIRTQLTEAQAIPPNGVAP